MNKKRITIVTILIFIVLAAGCSQNTVRERQDDATYRTSTHLIFYPDFADRSFKSSEDYMISTEFDDVTYIWPAGKGEFSKISNEIAFEGKNINCSVVERQLTINGSRIYEFEEGDRVRITGDGKVFVNDVKIKASGDT
jgi:hypothetical protein